jgi:hypothetical protein
MIRRTPLSRVSNKRRKDMKTYATLREAFLNEHHHCMAFFIIKKHLDPDGYCWEPTPEATEIHHVHKRGKNYLNVDTWLAVCRWSHVWIEEHKNIARQLGLLA